MFARAMIASRAIGWRVPPIAAAIKPVRPRRASQSGYRKVRCMQRPTRDHDEIRQWAASRNAVPAERKPRTFDSEPAILTFLFEEKREAMEDVAEISWEHFFALFDLMGLSLVHDDDGMFELLQIEKRSPYRFEGKPV